MRLLTPATYLTGARLKREIPGANLALTFAGVLLALSLVAASSARAAGMLYIRGGGSGHGIGMSQYGADGYAQHGFSYTQILSHYYTGTSLGQVAPGRTVRVLLADGGASFTGALAAGSIRLKATSTYAVSAAGARLQITGPGGARLGTPVSAPLTVTGPAPLMVPGLGHYRGSLQFRPDGRGGVETVNVVGLDDYVRGVVAAEMPSSWPAQALQAQAVAARTYAITAQVGAAGYDLYSDTRSQAYGGVAAETAPTDAAVAATAGQVVTYAGRPVVTYFFASSGGHTESVQNVWNGATPEPWLTGVPDPYDGAGGDPYHQWTQQLSLPAAQARLGSRVRGRLVGITVTHHGLSPRILTAAVVGTAGTTTVSGADLQSVFGLPTTYAAFTAITVTGGHGKLTGTVFPASAGRVSVQALGRSGGWQNLRRAAVSLRPALSRAAVPGRFTAAGLAPGRYRITAGSLTGPTVTVS
ncbi:MAG TPA: SpoIID/LytB domain-containing protein [Solirubrobacteraceae bacterium]|nr:SpoIID/LytB domain-containing protein [Solirubrobacteraceae bacterium]